MIKFDELADDPVINIALDTIKLKKQALIFVNTKRSAEKTAEEISKKIKGVNLGELSEKILKALSKPTKQCERLAKCIEKGIAFHHAGLTHKQKELIEDNFRNGVVKIICATFTLAYGVDLPAFRAILKDLKRYGHHGYAWIPVLEVQQMFGRAGRPNYDKEGQAICIAATEGEKKKIHERYILGKPEEIYSKLAVEPVLRTYLLSLIAADFVNTKKQIIDFFNKTFWAFQFEDIDKLKIIIERMLELLEEWEFIISSEKDDFKDASKLEDESYRATMIGKRVAELYIDPLTAYYILTCLRSASSRKVKAFSFLQVISHTLEMRPLLRVRTKEYDKIQEALLKDGDFLLEEEPSMYEPEYEDFLNSVKTALMFNDWINEKDEEFLLEEYNIRPGELNIKLELADWLLYATEELTRMLHFQSLVKEILKLRARLRYGVKEELLPLIRLENIGRARARKLYFNNIRDIADVKKADLMKLTQILGKNIAFDVKKQVGEEIKEIKLGKRKGQINLSDF